MLAYFYRFKQTAYFCVLLGVVQFVLQAACFYSFEMTDNGLTACFAALCDLVLD
jgi:heme/copper-type cytochrome/quinol oxidase subunit 4